MATYDPKLVQASHGSVILADFAEGTFIEVSQTNEAFELKQGAAGASEWVNKNMDMYDIKFTLLQTSPVNDLLSAALESDKSTNAGALPFMLKDAGPGGTTLVSFGEARIVKAPNAAYGDSTIGREWNLKACKKTSYNVGGMT